MCAQSIQDGSTSGEIPEAVLSPEGMTLLKGQNFLSRKRQYPQTSWKWKPILSLLGHLRKHPTEIGENHRDAEQKGVHTAQKEKPKHMRDAKPKTHHAKPEKRKKSR